MRKLKLQMQMSLDGYVAGSEGELDWVTWLWDQPLKDFVEKLHESVDTIIMGRKMSHGFTAHWESVVNDPKQQDYKLAELFVNLPKHIFSKTLTAHEGKNTLVMGGDLVEEVKKLKQQTGKDIIVYGGAEFVSNLIKENLMDELNFFINPTAISNGLSIFNQKTNLKLVKSKRFKCGIVVNTYQPLK